MQTINLVPMPQPGQQNGLGNGPVTFTSNDPKNLKPGDPFLIRLSEIPNINNVGYKLPGDGTVYGTYFGSTGTDGTLMIMATYTGTAPVDVTVGDGVILIAGIYPGNFPNPFGGGYRSCTFLPAPPPPPAATPGEAAFLTMIEASWGSGVPVASVSGDYAPVPVYIREPWMSASTPPSLMHMPDVSATKAALVAQALGGRVISQVTPGFMDRYPDATPWEGYPANPFVQYIEAAVPAGGPLQTANAFNLFAALNNRQSGIQKAIEATFDPAFPPPFLAV